MTELQLTELNITVQEWADFGPVEKLYLDVRQWLSEVNDLRWIDLEAGQLEIPEESYPVQFPCALIDFVDAGFENEQRGNQQGLISLVVRVGIDVYEDFHMIDAQSASDAGTAVKRLNLITQIHKALHGRETDYSTPLSRLSIQGERRDDGIKVFAITYGTAAKDDSGAKVYNRYTEATLQVNRT